METHSLRDIIRLKQKWRVEVFAADSNNLLKCMMLESRQEVVSFIRHPSIAT